MEWKVTKIKKDMRLFNNDMSSEIVKRGTRVLIAIDEDGAHYCPSWKELSAEEVKAEFEDNECFSYHDTVYTLKGNKVIIYIDTETTELFSM